MDIRKLFQRKQRVTVHLKSGQSVKFKCDSITTRTATDQSLISYKIEGSGKSVHYIRIDDISAITVK